MICCGVELTTPYCPHCGAKNPMAPALSLLELVQSHQSRIKSRAASIGAATRDKTTRKWRAAERWLIEQIGE